ncbi:MAG: sigma-E processing peptidase SpoIIGA [Thermanaeromonas sp.]|uniref:sigma-E processing peptidase SpoIIGA n=1 Tax=Thermanaeromonas sp. TaxID=2003697 RepID=UPI00243B402E|nr:sigma-E processing peptidase SpoIIGA [Thermanaeromonas sp.]MCG0276978.1 sigma-E processing peptidase SpoIIGA [Thermanaeromonas sp.]
MAGVQIVYLDMVLLVNLIMDYIILWATGRLAQVSTNGWRLLAGATLGAAYALTLFFPHREPWLWFLVKILFSFLMLLLAFYPLTWQKLLQVFGCFYLVSFIMGGAVVGGLYLSNNLLAAPALAGRGLLVHPLPSAWLVLGVLAAVFLVNWGSATIKKNFWQALLQLPIVIGLEGKRLALKALVDTGNNLRDPLTGRPVIIVEYQALKPILPEEIRSRVRAGEEPELEKIVTSLAGTAWATKVRIIPFHSLGRTGGLLLGFKPDEVIIFWEEQLIKITDVIVGLCWNRLAPGGNYRALLHPDLLEVETRV